MYGMLRSDHRKDSLQANSAYPLYGAAVGTKTHFVVNLNVADNSIFLHGPINSSSHTLP